MYHFKMPKLVTEFELALPPNRERVAAYRWLYSSVRDEILKGRLRPGTRLPSTRDLATQYGLARGTIVNAFEQLKSEGYVEGTVGSGTYVSRIVPESTFHVRSEQPARIRLPKRRTISEYAKQTRTFGTYDETPIRAFRANLPALDLFPTNLWTKSTLRCLRRITRSQLMGCGPLGYVPLRQAVAEYLSKSRGVRCAPDQLAIVSGVQEALELTARLLLNPGDRVRMENPGYPGAALVFQAYRARISWVPIDDEGISVPSLPARGVRLIYVTPGHQFPLGTTMTLARRLQLLQWARRSGTVIFEDDYDGEYRYSGKPIPALQGLDNSGSVLYAGSFSKVLFPALRLGYVVLPADLVNRFEALQSLSSRHATLLEQLVLCEFIREGHFGRHLRRMRQVYAERLAILLDESRIHLAGLLEISKVEAGLQTTGSLSKEINARSAVAAAAKRNVEVTPIDRYFSGQARSQAVQLGFAAFDGKEIRRGVRELAVALHELRSTG